MKILIITGSIYPTLGHNANLIMKLLPFFQASHDVTLLSCLSDESQAKKAPAVFRGSPIYWSFPRKKLRDRVVYPLASTLVDRHGFSDFLIGRILADRAGELCREHGFDAVLASTGPFPAMYAAAMMKGSLRRYLYMMDPSEKLWGHPGTPFRNRSLEQLLDRFDTVFTTEYAKEALLANGFGKLRCQISALGFPMIETHVWEPLPADIPMNHDRINLLFCGTLSKSLQRSPAYYLRLASGLDSRFRLFFVGTHCQNIVKEFDFHTDAEVVALPRVPYSVALSMMHSTDILINIGNRVRVHLPSKIIEYISMCKPIVNFYKFDDCPSLDYTSRYPLCLDIDEQTPVTKELLARFVEFCLSNRGKTADMSWVEKEFAECTPARIAEILLDGMTA